MKTILIKNNTAGYLTNTEAEGAVKSINSSEAKGQNALALGLGTEANGDNSLAEGEANYVRAKGSHVEGYGNNILEYSEYSHAEGRNNLIGYENDNGEIIGASWTHIEGYENQSQAEGSHIEGYNNVIYETGIHSHIEGSHNENYAENTHIEGSYNIVELNANNSHIEGSNNSTFYPLTHVEGIGNIGLAEGQHVEGRYNDPEGIDNCLLVIGNGENENTRSNALTLNDSGVLYVSNTVATENIQATSIWSKNGLQANGDIASAKGTLGGQNLDIGQSAFIGGDLRVDGKLTASSIEASCTYAGAYSGNGETQTIPLSFTPSWVLIQTQEFYNSDMYPNYKQQGCFGIWGAPTQAVETEGVSTTVLELIENGFTVTHNNIYNVNYGARTYIFIAGR